MVFDRLFDLPVVFALSKKPAGSPNERLLAIAGNLLRNLRRGESSGYRATRPSGGRRKGNGLERQRNSHRVGACFDLHHGRIHPTRVDESFTEAIVPLAQIGYVSICLQSI